MDPAGHFSDGGVVPLEWIDGIESGDLKRQPRQAAASSLWLCGPRSLAMQEHPDQ
jgi:hypothetical protein